MQSSFSFIEGSNQVILYTGILIGTTISTVGLYLIYKYLNSFRAK